MADILAILDDDSIEESTRIEQLANLFHSLDQTTLIELEPTSITTDANYKKVLTLIKFESLIINYPNEESQSIELLSDDIYSIALSSEMSLDYVHLYIKIKSSDVLTDYQYLYKDQGNMIELINKKILNLNQIDKSHQLLIKPIQLKILQLYLLSNYDFRKVQIFTYLNENLPNKYKTYLMDKNPLVSLQKFQSNLTDTFGYGTLFQNYVKRQVLISNWVENNLVRLNNYYKSIYISKIYKLLDIPLDFDLESLIFNMIIDQKLTCNSRLDQLSKTLVFGEEFPKSTTLNDHVKNLGSIVNEIYTRI